MVRTAMAKAAWLWLAAVLWAGAARAEDSPLVRNEKAECKYGRNKSCTKLGQRAEAGDGLPRSYGLAADYYRQACESFGGDPRGCALLGALYLEGKGVEKSAEQARRYLKKACVHEVEGACEKLAALDGTATRGDAAAWCGEDDPACTSPGAGRDGEEERLRASCKEGAAEDCLKLGRLLTAPGPDQDFERAASAFRRACDGGVAPGCSSLGYLYLLGKGVAARDPVAAAELYQRACDGGYVHGCSQLGESYLQGRGVEKDPRRALELASRACEGGCTDGCGLAGYILSNPRLGLREPARGMELLARACQGGLLESCALQGWRLADGDGVPKERERGLALVRKACEGDDTTGCYLQGVLLMESADPAEQELADRSLDKACSRGMEAACQARDRLLSGRIK